MSKSFTFKQFHIDACGCGMPVSTDAILLGSWANIKNAKTILDIGCGTGILAIMCAQRNQQANIIGIEIENNAYATATHNCKHSPWSSRLVIEHICLQDYNNKNSTFDAIICNPPYFNSGEQSMLSQRAIARHTAFLTHQTLLLSCESLLNQGGVASFILPKQEGQAFLDSIALLKRNGSPWQLTRRVNVKTTPHKQASRLLIEITKSAVCTNKACIDSQLLIHEGNQYSAEFTALTQAFYLKM